MNGTRGKEREREIAEKIKKPSKLDSITFATSESATPIKSQNRALSHSTIYICD